jgi:hypothetical protein
MSSLQGLPSGVVEGMPVTLKRGTATDRDEPEEVYTKEEVDVLLRRIDRFEKLLTSVLFILMVDHNNAHRGGAEDSRVPNFQENAVDVVGSLAKELGIRPPCQRDQWFDMAAVHSVKALMAMLSEEPESVPAPSRFEREPLV